MNRCITSFGFGQLKSWFDVSRPLMESYASRIGCEFFVPDKNYFSDWASKQSLFNWGIHHQMCWLKMPLLSSLLDEYDEVVWIDADVLVTGDDNVFDDMPAAPMGIAVHRFAAGEIPNTGVWAVRKPAKAILDSIEIDPDIVENAVWRGPVGYNGEMAMVLKRLGMDIDQPHLHLPPSDLWDELPYKYNAVFHDDREITPDAVFVHACGMDANMTIGAVVGNGIWSKEMVV